MDSRWALEPMQWCIREIFEDTHQNSVSNRVVVEDPLLVIRQFDQADQATVLDLHNLALTEVGVHAGNGPWDDDLQHIQEIYLDDRGTFLVGEYCGEIVAMGALKRISRADAEVKRMRVHPSFQRQGFGTQILRVLENRARELGYSVLRLDTTVEQIGARHLYAKFGFKETAHGLLFGMHTIFMEKTLAGPHQ